MPYYSIIRETAFVVQTVNDPEVGEIIRKNIIRVTMAQKN